jgi:PAS domain S-box-containing protein
MPGSVFPVKEWRAVNPTGSKSVSLPISPNKVDRQSAVHSHDNLGTAPAAELDVTTRVDSQLQDQDEDQARAQRHLESLLTSVPFGFAFIDHDLRFERFNDQFAEMHGLSVAAHLGKTVEEIAPTLEATLREVTARIRATGQPVLDHEFTGETVRAPGVIRTWSESWYPARDESGEIIGFSAVVTDITERKQAEAALQLTNQRFELAVKASQAVLFQQDLDLRFTWLHNPAPGIDGSDAVGKQEADLLERAGDVAVIEGLKREVIRSGVGMKREFFPQIQGVVHCFEVIMEPMRNADGHITGLTGAAIDITERHQTEMALRGNTALFSKIIEQAPGGVYVVDAQFRVAQMNAESLPFFAAAHPLIGRDFDEALEIVWGPDVGPQIANIFRHTLATGERYVSPRFSEQRHDIGVVQSFEWETQRITLPDGQHGVVCYFKDVTERERAETARRESDERLRLAIAGSDLGTWHWDIGTGEMEWSERCLNIFGIPAGTGMSREKFLGVLHPEDRARADDAMRSALQDSSEYRIELRSVWPDGSVHWAFSLGRVYCDATDKPIRVEGIALDTTERKRTEAALRETELHFQALAEASSDIAYRMSADWATMQPLDGRELVASSDRPLTDWAWLDQNLPRDEHARVRKAISDAIARKSLFELEHRVLRPDGSTGWTRSRAVPILDENKGLVTWFGAASDITERKRIELNLIEATSVAEKANRAKSDFLSSMSHELRTPLNAILGFAQLIESGAPAPTPTQRGNLEQILKGGWYLLDLVNELLDLAQIESGSLSVTQMPVSLAEVMLECRAMMEAQASQRAITVTFPAVELLGTVQADPTRLKQVIINLLSNAIKYNKAQGAVTVECALCSPDAIRISVRDTGEGLAPELLAQLFQPFNRLGREAGPEQGTGIGLVMSRRLVELMGGAIGAESAVGVGSVFWFELKLASAEQVGSQ